MKKFVTKTIFKKIQVHIVMKIFVTKTISYKILLHLAMKYFVTKTILVCYICDEKVRRQNLFSIFIFFHGFDINL